MEVEEEDICAINKYAILFCSTRFASVFACRIQIN